MLEIIVFIIIIMAVVQSSKKKNTRRQAPPFTARPQRPSGSFSSRPAQPSKPLVSGARQKKQKKNASGRKAEGASPVQASGGQSAETRTFIEPTRPYQPAAMPASGTRNGCLFRKGNGSATAATAELTT